MTLDFLVVQADAEFAEMADLLTLLADRTGEKAYLRAANALFHQPAGRPEVDDRQLIEEAQWLLASGAVSNKHQALLRVARTVSGRQSERAIAERLRRKMRNLPAK